MPRPAKHTPEQVIEVLRQTIGLAHLAAQQLGCSVRTIWRMAERHPSVREAIDDERGKRLDVAESALHRAVLNGEGWAICFTLKTQGKARGYVERQEITGASDQPVRLQVVEEIVAHPGIGRVQDPDGADVVA